jgi:hypothetical protein
MTKIGHNSVALAGEFAVLSQLALRGFDANMTLGNTKSVDILVADPLTENMFKLEVKTHANHRPSLSTLFGHTLDWILSEKHESIIASNLFYVFVSIAKEAQFFRFFIVPSDVVAKYVQEQTKYWLATRIKEVRGDNKIRMFRIGIDDVQQNYPIYTPLAKDYENRWDFQRIESRDFVN